MAATTRTTGQATSRPIPTRGSNMDKDLLINGEVHLFGDVGDTWSGDNFTPADVAHALAAHGDGDVTVRINSGGGIATDGMAIYSMFKSHPGKVNIVVD